jgi:succinoglycan biosynthesis protein ExoM
MTGLDDHQNSAAEVRVDICVCTYRREELKATLLSLAKLRLPENCRVRVIVADNDMEPSAKERVAHLAPELPFEVRYIHSPSANISLARNACLDASTGDYVAFIDDDETASEEWLAQLLTKARDANADAVLGPVQAIYASDAPQWMSKGDFHSTFPVWVRDEILTGYTCNVLLRRSSVAVGSRRFSLALGKTGGEDTQYFSELHEAGGKISFAADAWMFEPVTPGRAKFNWLCKRRFRMGQTHGRMLRSRTAGGGRAVQLLLAGAKAKFCMVVALLNAFSATRRNRWFLRGIMHAGAVSGLMGVREIEQYGLGQDAMITARSDKSRAA